MRADLHVHSRHSGPADLPVLRHVGRECYSEPLAVYETAMRRGMDRHFRAFEASVGGRVCPSLKHAPRPALQGTRP